MTAENGNGELRQLLEIKRGYRKELELLSRKNSRRNTSSTWLMARSA